MNNTTTTHKHVGLTDEKGIYAVNRDGNPLLCPKMMYPQINQVQNKLTGRVDFVTNIARLRCSTECPFAQIRVRHKNAPAENGGSVVLDELEHVYEISCEGGVREIVLDEVEEFKKDPEASGLLSVK